MSTKAKFKSDFKQVPAGPHPAYCWMVADIGWQRSQYGEKEQMIIGFEFPLQRIQIDGEDKPMVMSGFYGNSLGKKSTLRKDLEGWRGRPFTEEDIREGSFNIRKVLGTKCTVIVYHNENGDARIQGVSKMMDGVTLPPMYNPPTWFDLDEHQTGGPEFSQLPEWVQKKVRERISPPRGHDDEPEAVTMGDFEDSEIPF